MESISSKREYDEEEANKTRLMELEAIIHEHLGSGKFFLVGNFYFIILLLLYFFLFFIYITI